MLAHVLNLMATTCLSLTLQDGPTSRASRLVMNLPQPIGEREIARYQSYLKTSPEQGAHMHGLWLTYRASVEKIVQERRAALDPLSIEAAELSIQAPCSVQAVDAFERFWNEQLKTREALDEQDRALLQELNNILSDDQKELFFRVDWLRKRAKCGNYERSIAAAQIDISQLVPALCGSETAAGIDAILLQYETAATPLFDELDRLILEQRVPLQRMMHEILFFPDGTPNDFSDEAGQLRTREWTPRREKLLERTARLQRRIADLNDQFIDLIRPVLPEQTYRLVRDQYRQIAYWKLFPDRHSIENTLDNVRKRNDLQHADAIIALCDEHTQKYEAVCKEFMKRNMEWMEQIAATQAGHGYEAYHQRMRELREQRMRLHLTTLQRLRDIVTDNGPPDLLKSIASQRADIEQALQQVAADEFPGA